MTFCCCCLNVLMYVCICVKCIHMLLCLCTAYICVYVGMCEDTARTDPPKWSACATCWM